MAGYQTAVDTPNLSGVYIPTIWARQLLIAFYAATVFGAIATTEFEGLIQKQGDTVRVGTLPDITINDHVEGQDLEVENPSPSNVDLVIDKGKYYSFAVGDVTRKQSGIEYVKKWAAHASNGMKVAIDTQILANIYGSVHASNAGASAGAISGAIDLGATGDPHGITTANIISSILQCGLALDEQNVPDEDRWLVFPSWAIAKLKASDVKDASMMGDSVSVLRNGRVGRIDRFEIYQSNNLATSTDTHTCYEVLFGWKRAVAFASQMVKAESLRNQKAFGDIVRGLQVYGYKVMKPEGIGHLHMYDTGT